MKKIFSVFAYLLIVICIAVSCGTKEDPVVPDKPEPEPDPEPDSTEVAVEKVKVIPDSLRLAIGRELELSVTVLPENAKYDKIVWGSSNESVVTVTESGIVSAVAEGTADVIAKAGGKQGICHVVTFVETVVVDSVFLSKTSLSLNEGDSCTLTATVTPADATDKTVTWNSSDVGVASVDSEGNVTAVKAGVAIITACCGEKSATCTVTVNKVEIEIPVESITLSETSLNLTESEKHTLKATVTPADATDKTVTWNSSDVGVASVDSEGNVTAVGEGTSTITAICGEKIATCNVTVNKRVIEVTSITLSRSSLSLNEGDSYTLTATVTPVDATDKTVTWNSSDVGVASVDSEGNVTAVKAGVAIITACCGEKSATCTVTVNKVEIEIPVESITLSETSLNLNEGDGYTLTATVAPADATDKTITWNSSDVGVASVDSEGNVTAVSEGTSTITAICGGKIATCNVTVNKRVIEVTSITLSRSSLSLNEGDRYTLTATVTPADATDKIISWHSSDSSVVSVDSNGKVSAIMHGTSTITASCGEKKAECVVIVKNKGNVDTTINPWEDDEEDFGGTVN